MKVVNFFAGPGDGKSTTASLSDRRSVDSVAKSVIRQYAYTEVDGDESAPGKVYDLLMQGPSYCVD